MSIDASHTKANLPGIFLMLFIVHVSSGYWMSDWSIKTTKQTSVLNDKSSKTNSTIGLKSASRNFKLIEGRKLKCNVDLITY